MLREHFIGSTIGCVLIVLAVTSRAHAEATPAQKAAAEALFDSALKLMAEGHASEACVKLEESQRIDPGVGTLLYLADCYESTGRTASAWATFREAESRAGAEGQNERERTARERAARLEPSLAYVTLEVPADVRAIAGLKVEIGPEGIAPELFGTATPVDPGDARISVTAPGYEPFSRVVPVTRAARLHVAIPALRARGGPAPAAALPTTRPVPSTVSNAPQPVEHRASNDTLRITSFVLGGVGLVGIGVGSYFGLRAISKNHAATNGSCANGVCQEPGDLELASQARDAAALSNVAFVAGGAALAAGVVLYFIAPKTQREAVTITPTVTQHALALSIGGRL